MAPDERCTRPTRRVENANCRFTPERGGGGAAARLRYALTEPSAASGGREAWRDAFGAWKGKGRLRRARRGCAAGRVGALRPCGRIRDRRPPSNVDGGGCVVPGHLLSDERNMRRPGEPAVRCEAARVSLLRRIRRGVRSALRLGRAALGQLEQTRNSHRAAPGRLPGP